MRYAILLALSTVFLVGCGHKDDAVYVGADGSKVAVSHDASGNESTTIHATDKDGTQVNETFGKDNVSMSDSKGDSLTAAQGLVKESDLGLPFYPGSDESKDAGTSMISEDSKAKVVISYRSTKDDPAKVVEFYKDKIKGGQTTSSAAGSTKFATISGKLGGGAEASVMASNDGTKATVVMITVKTPKSS